jgi:hypothetical protein
VNNEPSVLLSKLARTHSLIDQLNDRLAVVSTNLPETATEASSKPGANSPVADDIENLNYRLERLLGRLEV